MMVTAQAAPSGAASSCSPAWIAQPTENPDKTEAGLALHPGPSYDQGVWSGLIFERCTHCTRLSVNAQAEGWRWYEDVDGVLHPFCLRCAESEFDLAPSSPPPVCVCPLCEGTLQPQPRGGWLCREHGLIVAPKVAARS
jgi:hypothetical protein